MDLGCGCKYDGAMRVLALDVGEKTIGVAVGDDDLGIASPLCTLSRAGGKRDAAAVAALFAEHQVELLVVGLPLDLNGRQGAAARRARRLVEQLEQTLACRCVWVDERFSTSRAEQALLEANVCRADRKQVVDKVAAAVILQRYFDSQARGGEQP